MNSEIENIVDKYKELSDANKLLFIGYLDDLLKIQDSPQALPDFH